MTFEKNVLGIVPGLQSLAVVGQASKMIPQEKDIWGKDSKKPLKQSKKLVKGFVGIMTTVPLIKPTANIIAKL